MCPEYGTLVAKVDVAGASDRTLHLAGSYERRGSSVYWIRWIYFCSDLSANCELGQADMDAGCLGTFRRESSAARTCVNATASSSVSGGNRSCTIAADWGQAATLRFDSVEGAGGDGLIGLFGADYERGPLLAGVALSRGAGEGAWTAGGRYGMDAALNPSSLGRLTDFVRR